MRRRALAIGAVVAATAGGAVLGWGAERRVMNRALPAADPEFEALRARIEGRPLRVESFDGTLLSGDILGDEGSPTLVFAHGFALSQHVWHYQRRDLSRHFRLVLYDQRGHGGSETAHSGDYSVQALGRDLDAVIEAAVPDGGPVVVVGHSLGGMSLLSWVEQFPEAVSDRLAGAVFLNTSGSDIVTGAVVSTGLVAAETLRKAVVDRAFRTLGRRPRLAERAYTASSDISYLLTRGLGLNPDASPAQVAFIEQMVLDCPTEVMAALGPLFTSLDLRDAARALKAPSLVMVGSRDRMTPIGSARKLAALLPDAELVEVHGAGHTSFLEAPDEVNGHIRRFAQRVLGR